MTMSNQPIDNKQAQRILHITFNMGFGGTEQVIRQLVMHLPKDQFNNEVLCIDGEVGEIGQRLEAEQGITIHTLTRQPGLDWRLAVNIRRHIKQGGFTIVHCHQYTPWFYGWLGSFGSGTRLVFTEHGRFYPDRHRRKAWLVNKLMARTTDAIVAISWATRDALVEYEFLPANKVQVIYNGIEPLSSGTEAGQAIRKSLGIPVEGFVAGTVARLDPVKNQAMMIRALHDMGEKRPTVFLLLVGDGPARNDLEELVKQFGLESRVIFTGFQKQPGLYLAAMDVFLLTSDTEGTSMTLLESMSLAKPCVATAVGGNPEIVTQNETGFLVEAGDSQGLAEKLELLRTQPLVRQAMAEAAHQRFLSSFSIEKMVTAYQALYEPMDRG
jgi:glycosyltransferase involved in cell wall biosynthesis